MQSSTFQNWSCTFFCISRTACSQPLAFPRGASTYSSPKLITNNKAITQYGFYDENNIFLLPEALSASAVEEIKVFLARLFYPYGKDVLAYYDFEHWVRQFQASSNPAQPFVKNIQNSGLNIVTLRLDYAYGIHVGGGEHEPLAALRDRRGVVACEDHQSPLYYLFASRAMTQHELAEMVQAAMGNGAEIVSVGHAAEKRIVLSHTLFESEFVTLFFCDVRDTIGKIAAKMKKESHVFLNEGKGKPSLR